MKRMEKKTRGLRSGLSLIETAIVLGVVSLVASAIWATASIVRARYVISDTVQIATEIANNVRNIYSGARTAVPPTIVLDQINARLFPLSVVNAAGTGTVNAWGGTIFIRFAPVTGGVPNSGFSVEFTIPATLDAASRREVCALMLSRMQGSDTVYGGGFTGTLPNTLPAIDDTQSGRPHFVFINNGAWTNVTKFSPATMFGGMGINLCNGFAYYYRL